jgi:hypothetical protein
MGDRVVHMTEFFDQIRFVLVENGHWAYISIVQLHLQVNISSCGFSLK